MFFRTKDGTIRHPEILSFIDTVWYHQMNNNTEYSVIEHNKKDKYIEAWLKGELRIFETEDVAIKTLTKEEKEKRDKDRSYVI